MTVPEKNWIHGEKVALGGVIAADGIGSSLAGDNGTSGAGNVEEGQVRGTR